MQLTITLFYERKEDIDYYFNFIEVQAQNESVDDKLIKIMKSNIILMLYNIIEASISQGFVEIFEKINTEELSYNSFIDELKKIWAYNQVSKIYGPETNKSTYQKKVKQMIETVLIENPITLDRDILDFEGNLDARKILHLCNNYKIRHQARDRDGCLYKVKTKRNSLAHGDDSFSQCVRDISLSELKLIKNTVFTFLENILNGMNDYYNNCRYKA